MKLRHSWSPTLTAQDILSFMQSRVLPGACAVPLPQYGASVALGRCCQGCDTVGISAVPTCFLGCWRWGPPKGSIWDIPAAPQRVYQSPWERSSSPTLCSVSALLEGWAQSHPQALGYVGGNSEIVQGALGQLMPGQHCHSGTSSVTSQARVLCSRGAPSPSLWSQHCEDHLAVILGVPAGREHPGPLAGTLRHMSRALLWSKQGAGQDLISGVCRSNPMSP